jgi:hypothetical protein
MVNAKSAVHHHQALPGHKGRGKILPGKTVVEQADKGALDICRGEAGVLDRRTGGAADQRFDVGVASAARRVAAAA